MKINENFLKIESSYLFSTVAKKQREYQAAHPDADVIRLSIGDVTKPLAPAVIDAMHKAVDEMANEATFKGFLTLSKSTIIPTGELILQKMKFSFLTEQRATAVISAIFLQLITKLQFATLFTLYM